MNIKHSLVIPSYNEEDNVLPFFNAAVAAMDGYTEDYELIFVNDGSKDGTQEALRALHAAHPERNIKVISFSRNFGKESAMYAGLKAACGEYITIIDADLQQPPSVAVQMGRILDEHPEYDIVAAYQEERKENAFIAWCKQCFYGLINRMTEVPFIPNASDFRTMRRPVVDAVLSLSEYHRFSKGIFSWVGFVSHPIPYEVQQREAGESKWNFMKLLKYALGGIMAYTDLPLKLPMYGGVTLMVISALLAILFLILQGCGIGVGLGFVICLMLFLVGLILIGQGILGSYLSKVHAQVKQRPIYLTKEYLTYDEKK